MSQGRENKGSLNVDNWAQSHWHITEDDLPHTSELCYQGIGNLCIFPLTSISHWIKVVSGGMKSSVLSGCLAFGLPKSQKNPQRSRMLQVVEMGCCQHVKELSTEATGELRGGWNG